MVFKYCYQSPNSLFTITNKCFKQYGRIKALYSCRVSATSPDTHLVTFAQLLECRFAVENPENWLLLSLYSVSHLLYHQYCGVETVYLVHTKFQLPTLCCKLVSHCFQLSIFQWIVLISFICYSHFTEFSKSWFALFLGKRPYHFFLLWGVERVF